MNDYQFIKTACSGGLARITLARPPLNILNIAMLRELNHAIQAIAEETDVCVLLIDGEGKTFSAGVDVPEHSPEHAEEMITTFHTTFRLLHQVPMPTVSAIQGGVYGGAMELAVFCDVILAADDLKIGVPEIKLGVFPPLAVAHLSRLIGAHKAAEMIFTGAVLNAKEAQTMGLINHCYPVGEFRDAVESFVRRFLELSPFSLRQVKRAFRRAVFADFETSLHTAETIYLQDLMQGHDPVEGLAAFTQKRKPVWTGR